MDWRQISGCHSNAFQVRNIDFQSYYLVKIIARALLLDCKEARHVAVLVRSYLVTTIDPLQWHLPQQIAITWSD